MVYYVSIRFKLNIMRKNGCFLVCRLNYFGCNGVLLVDPSPTLKSRPKSVSKSFRLTFCCWKNSAILLNPGRSRGSSLQHLLISCCSYKKCEKSDQQWWNHALTVTGNDKSRNIFALLYKKSVQISNRFWNLRAMQGYFPCLRSSVVCCIFRKKSFFPPFLSCNMVLLLELFKASFLKSSIT